MRFARLINVVICGVVVEDLGDEAVKVLGMPLEEEVVDRGPDVLVCAPFRVR